MTASIDNTIRSMRILEKALAEYQREAETLSKAQWRFVFDLATLLNSTRKCFESLAAQLRFYEGATNHGRALIDDDGTVIRGMAVEVLHIPVPGAERDAVIYGRADALAFVKEALEERSHQATGPGKIEDIARQLADSPEPTDQKALP
jgi:hypothetical protein